MFKKKIGILVILVAIVLLFIFQNFSQKLPERQQIDKLFNSNSPYEFVNYEVKEETPYVTFNDKSNNRQCRVNLIKDYKFGFFIGNWIFGMDWWCNK